MSTYAEKKKELRYIRNELDKNMDSYMKAVQSIEEEKKALKAAFNQRDAELNALLLNIKQTTDSKTIDDIIEDLNHEEDIERDILRELNEQGDFIIPNQTAFDKYSPAELFQAIGNLVEKGVLRKRDCEGVAYEYAA